MTSFQPDSKVNPVPAAFSAKPEPALSLGGVAPAAASATAAPAAAHGPAGPSPLNFMAEGATAGLSGTGAAAVANAVVPKKEYVDLGAAGKTSALVDLMDDSRDVLKQNGVSTRGEELLAGIMRNEGGRNERRKSMGTEWNRDAAALNKLDLAHLTDKQMKALTGDQKALLAKAQAGSLNLHDPEAVKNAGIDIRTDQYNQMQTLAAKTNRTKEENAQLAQLRAVKVAGGGSLNDFRGMSGDRFHQIFDEGQRRFELAQYKQFRSSFESKSAKQKPGTDMTINAGIGSAKLDATRQGQLHTNYDLLADYSTSYGTAQIMGLYADQGLLTSKTGSGDKHSYSLDELKGSAERFSPNSEDVGMQLAFMNMKGVDMGHPPSALSIAQKYNGNTPAAQPYADNMVAGADAYHAAAAARHNHK